MSPLSQLMQKVYGRLAIGSNVYAQRDLHVGPGSRLWAPNKLTVGNGVYVGKWCTIEIDGSIGDGCLIANSVGIVGRRDHDMSILGNPIRFAPWVGDHERLASTVTIGADVWIGYGAVVLGPC